MTDPVKEILIRWEVIREAADEEDAHERVAQIIEEHGCDWRRILGSPATTEEGLVYRVPPLNPFLRRT